MAIADTITSMQTHTSNAYTMIGYGTDLTGINKNLENLSSTIFEAFLEALRTPDTLFTNLPKKSGTGAVISLNDTANAPMRISLSATELSQSGTPTPSSPQDIHTISGSNKVVVSNSDNTISQEAEVDLTGKNIFDGSVGGSAGEYLTNTGSVSSGGSTLRYSNYIKLKEGQTSLYVSGMQDTMGTPAICFYNSSKTFISGVAYDSSIEKAITIPTNAVYFRTSYRTNNSYFMIEYGTKYTGYEAHLGINYCKIGNYEDKIFKNIPAFSEYDSNLIEGAWYIKKNIGKVVLDGTENWAKQDTWSSVGDKTNAFYIGKPTDLDAYHSCYCDYLKYVIASNIITTDDYGISYSASLILRMPKSLTDANALKTWLASNNVSVYYVLATPTYTQITGTLAEQLEYVYQKLLSYSGTTNISQVNNDLAFNMSVSAIEEL